MFHGKFCSTNIACKNDEAHNGRFGANCTEHQYCKGYRPNKYNYHIKIWRINVVRECNSRKTEAESVSKSFFQGKSKFAWKNKCSQETTKHITSWLVSRSVRKNMSMKGKTARRKHTAPSKVTFAS